MTYTFFIAKQLYVHIVTDIVYPVRHFYVCNSSKSIEDRK